MKILILEDNVRLGNLIKNALEQEGFDSDLFIDGEEALEAMANGYHQFILDINVPSIDGISLLETLRLYYKDTPVIIMSSNHELEKIQKAYELGCDDYLKKPFFIYELIQKVKKLANISDEKVELWKGYNYDHVDRKLTDPNGEEIKLAKKEILFLELFINNPKRVVSFDEVEMYVWEGEDTCIDNIRALLKRLRRKLPDDAIQTVPKVGFRLQNI